MWDSHNIPTEVSKILRQKLLGGPSPPAKYWGTMSPRPLLIDAYGYHHHLKAERCGPVGILFWKTMLDLWTWPV